MYSHRAVVVLTDESPLKISRCTSCSTQIVWAETERGRRMPVDVQRSDKGNLLLYSEAILEEIVGPYRVRVASPDELAWLKGNGWISHFATCPSAANHRKAG